MTSPADRSPADRRNPSRSDRAKKPAPSGVILWRPDVVLPSALTRIELPSRVTVAEPLHRPESVKARMDAAWSVLGSLADARRELGTRIAAAEARALEARSARERVSAAIHRYRAEAALNEVLSVTSNQMAALLNRTESQR